MTETTMKHPCPKCKKEMLMTPVCTECGIIPIAEGVVHGTEDGD